MVFNLCQKRLTQSKYCTTDKTQRTSTFHRNGKLLSRYVDTSLRYFSATNGVDIKNHAMGMDSIASTSFEQNKALLSREVKLAFPDFSQPFIIPTDASALQLGAVVAQNKKKVLLSFWESKIQRNGAIQHRAWIARHCRNSKGISHDFTRPQNPSIYRS